MKTKLKFLLPDGPVNGETTWAEKLGNGVFRLLNIPFFAIGYAQGDMVNCEAVAGEIRVLGMQKDSGNGTLRLFFSNIQDKDTQQVLQELTSVGATYEIAKDQLVAVNIPPNLGVPFSQLSNYLNGLSDKTLISWEVAKKFKREQDPSSVH